VLSVEPGSQRVDLNADLGEEITDDAALLQVVTSANVACGAHAGTVSIMRTVCALAVERGVAIGAQVSYVDRENFGRVARDVAPDVLREQIADQVEMLSALAVQAGGAVAYVKPHGALYHRVARDPDQAAAVLAGSGLLPVLGMPGARILSLAREQGRVTRLEGFPDRAYDGHGGLVSRDQPGAVISVAEEIVGQALRLAGRVDSLCVHGDNPGAVEHARLIRDALTSRGIGLETCW
jgi:UPF0271 protein